MVEQPGQLELSASREKSQRKKFLGIYTVGTMHPLFMPSSHTLWSSGDSGLRPFNARLLSGFLHCLQTAGSYLDQLQLLLTLVALMPPYLLI